MLESLIGHHQTQQESKLRAISHLQEVYAWCMESPTSPFSQVSLLVTSCTEMVHWLQLVWQWHALLFTKVQFRAHTWYTLSISLGRYIMLCAPHWNIIEPFPDLKPCEPHLLLLPCSNLPQTLSFLLPPEFHYFHYQIVRILQCTATHKVPSWVP